MHTFSINANVTPSSHSSLFLISHITLHKALFKWQFFLLSLSCVNTALTSLLLSYQFLTLFYVNYNYMLILTLPVFNLKVALCLLQVYMMGFYDTRGTELTPQNEPKRFILSNCLSLCCIYADNYLDCHLCVYLVELELNLNCPSLYDTVCRHRPHTLHLCTSSYII